MNYLDCGYLPVRDFALMGTNFKNSKERIYNFFTQNHTNKEKVAFLKEEYGCGGFGCDTLTPCTISAANWNATEITLNFYYPNGMKGGCRFGYAVLSSMIDDMIADGVYLKAKTLLALSNVLEKEKKEEEENNKPIKVDLWAVKKAIAPVFRADVIVGQMHICDYVNFG